MKHLDHLLTIMLLIGVTRSQAQSLYVPSGTAGIAPVANCATGVLPVSVGAFNADCRSRFYVEHRNQANAGERFGTFSYMEQNGTNTQGSGEYRGVFGHMNVTAAGSTRNPNQNDQAIGVYGRLSVIPSANGEIPQVTRGYGLRGEVATGGFIATAYGVQGIVSSGTVRYGVHGQASTALPNSWAMWSNGNQFSTTSTQWTFSDRSLKTDIKPLKGSLSAILKLAPKTYQFQHDLHPGLNLSQGEQMGLIAQEVETVIPSLVMDVHHPAQFDEQGKLIDAAFDMKAMSYTGLIPMLVGSIQEQQAIIDEQSSRIDQLEADLASIKAALGKPSMGSNASQPAKARLEQNAPNPFNTNTTIAYQIPDGTSKAAIVVRTSEGKVWRSFDGLAAGQGQLVIAAGTLTAGSYTYSLVIDGTATETRTMLITR
jgi:hypothetical protein